MKVLCKFLCPGNSPRGDLKGNVICIIVGVGCISQRVTSLCFPHSLCLETAGCGDALKRWSPRLHNGAVPCPSSAFGTVFYTQIRITCWAKPSVPDNRPSRKALAEQCTKPCWIHFVARSLGRGIFWQQDLSQCNNSSKHAGSCRLGTWDKMGDQAHYWGVITGDNSAWLLRKDRWHIWQLVLWWYLQWMVVMVMRWGRSSKS